MYRIVQHNGYVELQKRSFVFMWHTVREKENDLKFQRWDTALDAQRSLYDSIGMAEANKIPVVNAS
jgi:hypothetical protein